MNIYFNRNMYFDKAGKVLQLHEWTALFEDDDYRYIAFDELEYCSVSTVWIGLSHDPRNEMPVGIFETMIFGDPKNMPTPTGPDPISAALYRITTNLMEHAAWRSSSEAQALQLHIRLITKLRRIEKLAEE
jgi:hypothetical protein